MEFYVQDVHEIVNSISENESFQVDLVGQTFRSACCIACLHQADLKICPTMCLQVDLEGMSKGRHVKGACQRDGDNDMFPVAQMLSFIHLSKHSPRLRREGDSRGIKRGGANRKLEKVKLCIFFSLDFPFAIEEVVVFYVILSVSEGSFCHVIQKDSSLRLRSFRMTLLLSLLLRVFVGAGSRSCPKHLLLFQAQCQVLHTFPSSRAKRSEVEGSSPLLLRGTTPSGAAPSTSHRAGR